MLQVKRQGRRVKAYGPTVGKFVNKLAYQGNVGFRTVPIRGVRMVLAV